MNLKHMLKLLVILLASISLVTVAACGDDDSEGGQTNQNNANSNNSGNNNTNNHENDVGVPDDADNTNNNNTNNNNNNGGGLEPVEPTPTCDDDVKPDRCEDDPADFEFGPASHVTELAVADETCCVDFNVSGETGYGDPNNALFDIIDSLSDLGTVNEGIQSSIDDGDVNLVLEHDGLTDLTDGAEFDINFLLAELVDEEGALIDPVSFESGAHPHALLPDAKLIDDGEGNITLEAGPGTVFLSINLASFIPGDDMDVELELAISHASLTADVVEAESSIEDGVTLENGRLGGLIFLEDLINAINTFGETCECLGSPEKIAEFNPNGPPSCVLDTSHEDVDLDQCIDEEEICGNFDEICDFMPALGLLTDVSTTPDNPRNNALSVGLLINSAVATTIVGIGDGALVAD